MRKFWRHDSHPEDDWQHHTSAKFWIKR